MDRRDFLKFLGMASSATVLSSCGVEKTTEKLIPFLIPPDEGYIPGEAIYKNAACNECPAGCGTSVKIVDFNPVKLEGNPEHPLNDGALCLRGQASLMRLYHPKRIKTPMIRSKKGLILEEMLEGKFKNISWQEAYDLILTEMKNAASQGRNNVFFSGATSGTLSELIDSFCKETGVERLPEYETFAFANLREANKLLFGKGEIPAYHVKESGFLLTIGADILETFVNPVNFAKDVHHSREHNQMNWIHVEPHASLTGFQADKRLTIRPESEAYLLLYLIQYLTTNKLATRSLPDNLVSALPRVTLQKVSQETGIATEAINDLAQQFGEALARKPLLIAGGVSTSSERGLEVAVLAGVLQWITGMVGETVDFTHSLNMSNVGTLNDIKALADRLAKDEIGVMFVSNSDPLSSIPQATGFSENFEKATFKVAFTDLLTPSAEACDLILPLSHPFESWGDSSPRKGLINFNQPVIEKLYDTRSVGDILLNLKDLVKGNNPQTLYDDWVQAYWQRKVGQEQFATALEKGFYVESVPSVNVRLSTRNLAAFLQEARWDVPASEKVLIAMPSLRTYDGRSRALPMTSEVPDPLTTISYGHWVSISRESADELGIPEKPLVKKHRDVVEVKKNGGELKVPAIIQPGLSASVMTVHLDQIPKSFLSMDERTGEMVVYAKGVEVSRTGMTRPVAIMSGGFDQEDRNIIPSEHEEEAHHNFRGDETLYPHHEHPEYRWALAVDLESCTGCSACVAACHIENNVPCVGEEEHILGREMSWIRVQPYYDDHDNMDVLLMMCQQCDAAPCENVCPVFATYHNQEGLNVMVYNRCVGTRYCHNNCPYKVRRFNWFDWTNEGYWQEPMVRMANPEIWIRPKGVMEKCTFCVQRIRKAKDIAKDEARKVQDGEIVPACAQTCPTNAIVFGNILDENSKVYQLSQSERKFRVLEILGTQPAVHYLRKEEKA